MSNWSYQHLGAWYHCLVLRGLGTCKKWLEYLVKSSRFNLPGPGFVSTSPANWRSFNLTMDRKHWSTSIHNMWQHTAITITDMSSRESFERESAAYKQILYWDMVGNTHARHLLFAPTASYRISGLFSRHLSFANFARAQPIFENLNLECGVGAVQYLHSWNYFSRTRIELAVREI